MFTDTTHPKITREELDNQLTSKVPNCIHPFLMHVYTSTLSFTRNTKHHFSTPDTEIQLRTKFYTLLVQNLGRGEAGCKTGGGCPKGVDKYIFEG